MNRRRSLIASAGSSLAVLLALCGNVRGQEGDSSANLRSEREDSTNESRPLAIELRSDSAATEAAKDDATRGPGSEAIEPSEAFVRGNQAYEEGRYDEAVAYYEAVVSGGAYGGEVYYNLGNAYLRSGQLGRAIASYRRSQALLPRDQDVVANLGFARQSRRDALDPPTASPVLRTLFFWHFGLSTDECLRLAIVLHVLLWGFLAVRLYWRRSEVLVWTVGLLFVATLAVAGSLVTRLVTPTRLAVILPQEADVHSGTDMESVVRFKLHAGAEVRLLEARDGWLRIGLPDGQQGWIEDSHAETVIFR